MLAPQSEAIVAADRGRPSRSAPPCNSRRQHGLNRVQISATNQQEVEHLMLVVTRKLGEQVQIGDEITITVTRIDDHEVRIGVQAPNEMVIVRQELIDPSAKRRKSTREQSS